MGSYLGEVRIRRTSKGLRENEVERNVGNGGYALKLRYHVKTFFFLHCRTSARHCRSTTGMGEERKQIFPKAKANKNKHTKKQRPQNQTRQRSREICKKGETCETSASLSSPSRVLFRQVVLPHVVHV